MVAMVLLGNKMDCEEERQVPTEAGRRLAQVSTRTAMFGMTQGGGGGNGDTEFPALLFLPPPSSRADQSVSPCRCAMGSNPGCAGRRHLEPCVKLADSHSFPTHVKNIFRVKAVLKASLKSPIKS